MALLMLSPAPSSSSITVSEIPCDSESGWETVLLPWGALCIILLLFLLLLFLHCEEGACN